MSASRSFSIEVNGKDIPVDDDGFLLDPEAKHLLKELKNRDSKEKGTRRYVYDLFPYGYGQMACKIAGLRKPLKLLLDL